MDTRIPIHTNINKRSMQSLFYVSLNIFFYVQLLQKCHKQPGFSYMYTDTVYVADMLHFLSVWMYWFLIDIFKKRLRLDLFIRGGILQVHIYVLCVIQCVCVCV